MSAPIRVGRFDYRGWCGEPAHSWIWDCTECNGGYLSRLVGYSHPEALAAGLAHLAKKHPDVVWTAGGRVYEATTSVQPANRVEAHGDPNGLKVAQNRAAQAPLPYYGPLDTAHNEGSRR